MTSNDVLALLARENPVREEDIPAAQALKLRILASDSSKDAAPIEEEARATRRPRRWVVAGTTAAALTTLAIVTLPGALTEERLGASPAAAAVLERAAEAATAYTGPATGRYAYTKAETLYAAISTDDPPFTLLIPSVRETWVADDGAGRVVETRKEPIFLGPRDRERWQAAGAWQPPRLEIDRLVDAHRPVPADLLERDPEDLTLEEIDRLINAVPQLPADPARLVRIIRAYSEQKDLPVEAQMFNQVSSLLHSPYASAELRAAAYRVLAGIEGVELEGQRRDSTGRLGVAISAPAGYGGRGGGLNEDARRRLIIDPATGNVLAEETVLMRPVAWLDGKPGDITGSITILEQGWVDSLEQRPR